MYVAHTLLWFYYPQIFADSKTAYLLTPRY